MDAIELVTGYVPGMIGWVTQIQGIYYAENHGLGLYFEAKAAAELAAFMSSYNPDCDGAWLARIGETMVGAIFIVGGAAKGEGARLRWFIIDPAYQGRGIGHRLINEAVAFCKQRGFKRIYLTTFAGLHAARHLYEQAGFRLYHEEDGTHLTGSSALVEQKFELLLNETAEHAPEA